MADRVFIDSAVYIGTRCTDAPANGRVMRQAVCGHKVWLSERGLDAIGRRGKTLFCDVCYIAFAEEQGAGVISTTDPW